MSFSVPVCVSKFICLHAYCTSLNISVFVTAYSRLLLMKVWSGDQQGCYHLESGSVQLLSCVWLFVTPWTARGPVTPGLPVHHQLLELTQTHVHWVSDSIQPSPLCHPLFLSPSIFPSIRVFSNESVLCIRWPKYWCFSFSISPSNEYSGLISCRMDWLDLLSVQGTLKSLLQHPSSKASILQCSAFL